MIQKLKSKLLILSSLILLGMPMAVPAVALAQQSPDIPGSVCGGADKLQIDGTTDCQTLSQEGANDPNALIRKVINILSVIVGIIAVIMIIIGGFRYITSGGASEKVTSAKNTLLYAIIGLIIVALAQVIVRFVLRNTTG